MSQQIRKTLQVQIASQQNKSTSRFKLLKKKLVGHKTECFSKVQSAIWKLLDHPQVSLPTRPQVIPYKQS